jgi:hypothetical protein
MDLIFGQVISCILCSSSLMLLCMICNKIGCISNSRLAKMLFELDGFVEAHALLSSEDC